MEPRLAGTGRADFTPFQIERSFLWPGFRSADHPMDAVFILSIFDEPAPCIVFGLFTCPFGKPSPQTNRPKTRLPGFRQPQWFLMVLWCRRVYDSPGADLTPPHAIIIKPDMPDDEL